LLRLWGRKKKREMIHPGQKSLDQKLRGGGENQKRGKPGTRGEKKKVLAAFNRALKEKRKQD